jgi:hypothetical protein
MTGERSHGAWRANGKSHRAKVAQNAFGQGLLDFIVARNGFDHTRAWIGPERVVGAFSFKIATGAPQLLFQRAAFQSNRHDGLDRISAKPSTHVFQTVGEDERNGLAKTFLGFFNRLSLTVSTGNFRANGPEPPLGRFLNDSSEFAFHNFQLTRSLRAGKQSAVILLLPVLLRPGGG